MRLPRPDSLRGLIILGTLLVAVPLCTVLGHSMLQLRALSQRSTALIAHTANATSQSDELARASANLERLARLRQALGDPSLDEGFFENVARALQAIDTLITMDVSQTLADCKAARAQVVALRDAYQEAIKRQAKAGDPVLQAAIDKNDDLQQPVIRINQKLAQRTAATLEELQGSTAQTESRLFQELSVLLPVTLILVVAFLLAVSRPLRRIDRAIEALGRGRYDSPISIRGPTDLVKLGQQLEWLRLRLIEVAEAKNRFLRHMSHELKTPLASIREGTELLLEGAVGPVGTEQREVIGILRDNGIQLQRHIENMLSYSAWEARTVGLDLEEFPIRELVRTVIDAHRMTLLAHRLRLSVEVGDFKVTADRAKLRLILDNLISNAVKYTPHDGSIRVNAASDGTGLVVDVIDSGPGIAPEDRAHLFEAFYTGRSQATGPLRGTGIGLSVVLEFTEAHGGTIILIDREGGGAHFRLRLPAYPRPVRRPVPAPHE
jgi:two-component system sensor histidine kinase GlrK